MVKALISTCILTALVCGAVAPATASTFDKRTYFTFSQPVALPGVTLPAGSYTFHLVSPFTDPKVIQVMDRGGMHSYAMLMAISANRAEASTKPEIEFMETGTGMPNAVRGWWYPGETTGYQFIYPKDQLRRLTAGVAPVPSAVTSEAVPAAESAARAEAEPSAEVKVEPRAEEATASAPAEEAAAPEQATTSAAQTSAPAPVQQEARTELPKTASPIWLMLALGTLTSLSGVLLVRGARRA